MANKKYKRYTRKIIDDYCVLDTETTGLSAYYDEIIEIGILKVRNNQVVDEYSQLIQPKRRISSFITSLTGITNEMVEGMPTITQVKSNVQSFLGDDVILGHYTSFDIRFLDTGFQELLENNYMDTLQFARKVYPELKRHKLSDLTSFLGLSNNKHRAIADCISTKELYDAMKEKMLANNWTLQDLWRRTSGGGFNIGSIIPTNLDIDEESYFFGKQVVFTGKLERMVRRDAMQAVVDLGGALGNGVTKKTNCLILGNTDYCYSLKGKKSSKHVKAENLKLEGQDIEIIDEFTFYDLLDD